MLLNRSVLVIFLCRIEIFVEFRVCSHTRNFLKRSGEEAMKITAILVIKAPAVQGGESIMLANVSDVSHFGFFQRQAAKEFILFASRTIAGRTPLGQRQSVEQDGEYMYLAWLSFLVSLFFFFFNLRS